jgi:manganese efflux pump family protein
MAALLLVAASLGLDNFAACIGIGASGVDAGTRLRVGIIFGAFEAGMPILGLLAGRGLAATLGQAAHWVGAGLLIATGGYALVQAIRHRGTDGAEGEVPSGQRTGRLLLTGLALSIDNLAVGFALGTLHVSLAVTVIVIGAVSVTMSLLGLELGRRIGDWVGELGEVAGGVVLVGVGVAIATGVL